MIPQDITFLPQDTNILTTPEIVKEKLIIKRNVPIIIFTVTAIALTALVVVAAIVLHFVGAAYLPLLITGFGILLPILYKFVFEKYVKQIIAASDAIIIENAVIYKQKQAIANDEIDTSNTNYMYNVRIEVLEGEITNLNRRITRDDLKKSPFKLIAKKVQHVVEKSFCNYLKLNPEAESASLLSSRASFPAEKYKGFERELALLNRLPMFIKDGVKFFYSNLDKEYNTNDPINWSLSTTEPDPSEVYI